MFLMYDDVTLSLIPAGAHAVGCYRNGRYANEDEARRRFPHAWILPFSVSGDVACDTYDVETGDYRPGDVGPLYRIAKGAGIWRPCFYANLSTMPAVRHALSVAGVPRDDVRLLVAAYDGVAVIPPGYDGKQFTDRALDRSLDESILADNFFRPRPHAAATPARQPGKLDEARVSFDADSGEWAIHPLPFGREPAGQ